jgi:uridine monophosphate synthetase
MENVVELMWAKLQGLLPFELVCGVPYGALPFAACMAIKHSVPMIVCRKEMAAKDYGTKNEVEGVFAKGQRCLIIEDVITSGISIEQTANGLRRNGLQVEQAVVFLDREQGGVSRLATLQQSDEAQGGGPIFVHPVVTLRQMMHILRDKIDKKLAQTVEEYLNTVSTTPTSSSTISPPVKESQKPKRLTYGQRQAKCRSGVGQKLLQIMEQKQTNLVVAADVTSKTELFSLAEKLGPKICMFKTHADTIEDWDPQTTGPELRQIAQKHNFLIFEDRKFADIGAVVMRQYGGGLYRICDWADVVTVHLVAGASVISSLKEVARNNGLDKERGILLISQMSTVDAGQSVEETATTAALENGDFVLGFICQHNFFMEGKGKQQQQQEQAQEFLFCTPGVRAEPGGDGLGQRYRTPEMVIDSGCDVIIVGRGICAAADPVAVAEKYRQRGWQAYLNSIDAGGSE